MKKTNTRAVALLLSIALVLGLCPFAGAAVSTNQLKTSLAESSGYILNTVKTPQVGSIGGEWAVLGLARGSYTVPQTYWDNYYRTVEEYVKSCNGILHDKKYTEYSRVVVALTSIGADPTNVAGYNLLMPLGDFDKTIWQGINGPIWALIALDSGNYDMPKNESAQTQATRQKYIDEIISRQLNDGGWSLNGKGGSGQSDPDITGMALQALAKYQNQGAVKKATEEALACMSKRQNTKGGFSSWGDENVESTIQMLVALCELGIDVNDSRFVKNGNSLLDNIFSYRKADGSFQHTTSGSGSNLMASEQGLYVLVAAQRAAEKKSSLYRMDDVTIRVSGNTGNTPSEGLPGKNSDVKKKPIVAPGVTFPDISAHKNQPAIEAMAARKIIDGKSSDRFDPNGTLTRAEAAAILVRSLGLTPRAVKTFQDVPDGQWYTDYIGTAYTYGLINGKTSTRFDPQGTITREEASAIVTRAAKLCGMNTEMTSSETLDTLAQFGDYITIAQWARENMAFCYRNDILDQNDLNVEPKRPILRCEMAQMLYNLLGGARLL